VLIKMISELLNPILSPLLMFSPSLSIFIVGLIIITITNIVNKKALGTEAAKKIKQEMQELREKMLVAQKAGNIEEMNKYLSEIMKTNSRYFKFTLKPLIVSMFLIILIFPWLRATYTGTVVATIPQAFPIIGGYELSWFIWYIICSFSLSIVIRKIIGV